MLRWTSTEPAVASCPGPCRSRKTRCRIGKWRCRETSPRSTGSSRDRWSAARRNSPRRRRPARRAAPMSTPTGSRAPCTRSGSSLHDSPPRTPPRICGSPWCPMASPWRSCKASLSGSTCCRRLSHSSGSWEVSCMTPRASCCSHASRTYPRGDPRRTSAKGCRRKVGRKPWHRHYRRRSCRRPACSSTRRLVAIQKTAPR
mmetsp:Transcript_25968/g.74995  ORF Transcript_25968/g.74995 Transcript_25968/m.74995 type:complete len:201 (-) Transcript_25968:210-812(-)